MAKQSASPSLRTGAYQLYDRLGAFWYWWTGELMGVLPSTLRNKLHRRGQYLMAELHDGQCSIRYGSRGNLMPVTRFAIQEEPLIADDIRQQLTELGRKADQVILLIPPEMLLTKTLQLPAATENGLENVLRFEMDRHTPFTAEQVYYGFRVIERDTKTQRISVALKLMARVKLDPLLRTLEVSGVHPTVVAPAAEASNDLYSVNILPKSMQPPQDRKARSRRWLLFVLFVLFILAVTVPVYQQEARVESLRAEISAPKALAEKAQVVSEQVKVLTESRQFLVNKKNSEPSALILLNELTQLLPDHTWISRFELRGRDIKLQGESSEASELIGLMEGTGYLGNVRFSSPVTSNPRNQKERFVIVAQLLQEEAL
ncbi:MAG: PilN domain-containing protein [Oceanospirillaceae bacterium]|nr:PilN domain-containing protein [Oceanospirillaceae bacterium]